ncbi:unnamed protein product [Adineta steineri]|uniref:Uncharacterized protein n=1 Tax=Adineta steineri TaxID=433720 RepID=A0A819TND1_9BILA|nr:unnamed protein product [Adineta steineri]
MDIVTYISPSNFGYSYANKKCCFVEGSIYFDALQYRQSPDRTGRRGFDIPLSKIYRLTISAISNIHAHFSNKRYIPYASFSFMYKC